ncbi:hypothetical protein HQ529_03355 [Candidatus Woesearchaeota archaeon]|nr:hypothetical protein [Candidatus Woesearchaeota archaeon]
MTIEYYLQMADEAEQEGAHVASMVNYTYAADVMKNNEEMDLLVETVKKYESNLKKELDRKAVQEWYNKFIPFENDLKIQ